MKRYFSILILLFCVATGISAQELLKGKVVDTSNEPIIGAQVRWDESTTGTVTNIDGEFLLPVSAQKKALVVSFIGYSTSKTQIPEGQTNVVVTLKVDAQNLDELVVVGYGVQKKANLTGSVETIKAEDLLMMPTANLDQALQGQVAGMQVMQQTGDPSSAKEMNIHIRGINDSPLLVIDGVPRFGTNTSDGETRLSDLNPDDIESVSILKDAAAAAVYGSRAANGVILVQTKRAKGNRTIQLNYRGQFNLQEATRLPEFLDSYQYALLRNQAIENSPATTLTPYTAAQLEQIRTGSNPNVYGNENILDYLDKTGWTTTHSVSANGGNDFVNYYLSFGYADSKGLYSGVGRSRLNYSLKLDANIAKGLVLSVDYTGSRTNARNTSYTTLDAAYSYSPLQVLEYPNGMLASSNGANPLISIRGLGGYMDNSGKMGTITANLRWQLPWVKGLSAYLRGTFDDNSRIDKTYSKPTTLYTYSETTKEYSVDPNTIYPTAKVSLMQNDRTYEGLLYEAGLNFNREFGKHDIGATLVANYQRTRNIYMSGTNQDMSPYPETIGTAQTAKLNGDESILERASLIGRATYGYDRRYFAEFSFRVDGSTSFTPEKRWGFFPSLSASWVMSNEKFFQNWKQDVLTNVKFRASTGWLGNDGTVGAYSYLKTYGETVNSGYSIGGSFRPGLMISGMPNPDLTWGRSHDYNVALDLGFWGGRIGLTMEYYTRYETNKITSAPDYLFPPSTGLNGNVPEMNFAELKAWGWDITLTHRNTIGKLKYNVGLTLAKNDDEYIDFGDESAQLPNLRRVGKSSMVWTMYESLGLFQSQEEIDSWPLDQDGSGNSTLAPGDIKYKDQNGDKILDSYDRIYVKNSAYPDMDMSVKLGVQYKGFFVNALFQGEFGFKQNITESYTQENGSMQKFQSYHLTDTWTPENPNAMYPRIKIATSNDNNRKASTFWIRDCNFMRLKMLSIGYQFPTSVIHKLKIRSLSLALQGSNILTWSSLKEMDPESLRGYPVQRSYGATLNIGI